MKTYGTRSKVTMLQAPQKRFCGAVFGRLSKSDAHGICYARDVGLMRKGVSR